MRLEAATANSGQLNVPDLAEVMAMLPSHEPDMDWRYLLAFLPPAKLYRVDLQML